MLTSSHGVAGGGRALSRRVGRVFAGAPLCVRGYGRRRLRRSGMKAQWLALITAAAWGIGGYFEKKGLHDGNLPPQVGITVRAAIAAVVLGAISIPQLWTLQKAG